ncbi:MAG TPA: molybdopterin-binding/glycosyltransferase family 2 protein [Candidatus Binatia bacterium]|nr:molybdopterin-binding/glycosyltransferase family 2 protein [Candidatus Binatia bacterium]
MIFAELPIADCADTILVHTQRWNGQAFKKGRRLSKEDVAQLQSAGIDRLTVVRLEPDDVAEDRAAQELAVALLANHLRVDPSFTGRANLYAECDGLFLPQAAAVDRINRVSDDITLATLPAYAPVTKSQMVATVKIIPFAVKRAALDRCLAAAREAAALALSPYRPRRVALIQTELSGMKPSLFEKAVGVMNERLAAFGNPPVAESRAAHAAPALADAIRAVKSADLILVMGASAIADRHDVIPAAIEAAGGEIRRFGMPVDPGNLLVLGDLAGKPVIGLPGCARSPKVNGFDWVLQRVMADVPVGHDDIAAMGVGGLLGEIASRPQPRDHRLEETPAAGGPRIAALILAAGQSSRMGRNKLLLELKGKPILCHAVDHVLAAGLAEVIVVCGHQAGKVRTALGDRPVKVIEAREHRLGMSASLKAGIRALGPKVDAILVMLGDMPQVPPGLIRRLIAAYNPLEGRGIVVPTVEGKRGNPVLFDRRFFPEMLELEGDVGARHLIGTHDDQVAEVAVEDAGVFADVDTPEAYDRLLAKVPQ